MAAWLHCEHCGGITDARWDFSAHRWRCADCDGFVVPPPPGSMDAVLEHCECDPDINNRGRVMPERGWLIVAGCPLHDPDRWDGPPEEDR